MTTFRFEKVAVKKFLAVVEFQGINLKLFVKIRGIYTEASLLQLWNEKGISKKSLENETPEYFNLFFSQEMVIFFFRKVLLEKINLYID